MRTELKPITPALARDWLKRNTGNRPLRQSNVESWKLILQRGEYKLTHQGIAFLKDGMLADGQHRLSAIAEMPDSFSVQMLVTFDLPPDAFLGMDQGVKRTTADILGKDQGLAAVARYMAVIVENTNGGITPQLLVPYIRGAAGAFDIITSFCPKVTKNWSSAPVRTAAILRVIEGADLDYVRLSYHALNHAEFDSMSLVIQALYRQQLTNVASTRGKDLFCRSYKAFDPAARALRKIQINDVSTYLTQARATIQTRVLAEKKASAKAPAARMNAENSKAALGA